MTKFLSDKQLKCVIEPKAKWNLAYGAVRAGKSVGFSMAFLNDAAAWPDSKIYIIGHTFDTAYRNVVRPMLESPEFFVYRPFLRWSGKKLYYRDKEITVMGAKDEGALGAFQGLTMSLILCDEITLYPESIIDMIDTRLSLNYSRAYATMNPTHPSHKIKKWIDMGEAGDNNYKSTHFTLDDNPFIEQDYKDRLRNSLSGVFYKRNYLGLWCMAEGAIFDFFDYQIHTCERAPAAADYFIAGIDYGASNPFACLVLGVHTGIRTQQGKKIWVEDEYYWDPKAQMKQKVNSDYAADLQEFLEPYGIRNLYIDPSAAAMKKELNKLGIHTVDADNDVENGIQVMTTEMYKGTLSVRRRCKNTIREIETYVWDIKASEKGYDEPVKKKDHAVDALRYCLKTHKIPEYKPYKENHDPEAYKQGRFNTGKRTF